MFNNYRQKRRLRKAIKRANNRFELTRKTQFVLPFKNSYIVVDNSYTAEYNKRAKRLVLKKIDVFYLSNNNCYSVGEVNKQTQNNKK